MKVWCPFKVMASSLAALLSLSLGNACQASCTRRTLHGKALYKAFHTDTRAQFFLRRCDVAWPCLESTCQPKDPCPIGWIHIGEECPCSVLAKFALRFTHTFRKYAWPHCRISQPQTGTDIQSHPTAAKCFLVHLDSPITRSFRQWPVARNEISCQNRGA